MLTLLSVRWNVPTFSWSQQLVRWFCQLDRKTFFSLIYGAERGIRQLPWGFANFHMGEGDASDGDFPTTTHGAGLYLLLRGNQERCFLVFEAPGMGGLRSLERGTRLTPHEMVTRS